MEFLSLAKERYSVRKFAKTPVEQDKVDLILEAGRIAPTAGNLQPQRIYLIQSEEQLDKIKNCTRYDFHSPLYFIIGYDNEISWKRRYDGHDSGDVDCAIVATHMMLEAWESGIGSTWIASFDPKILKQEFALPTEFIPVLMFAMGYAAEDNQPGPMHFQRNQWIKGSNLIIK